MKAVTKYGKDYEKITRLLKNKTKAQIHHKVSGTIKQVKSKPKHKNAKYAKILKKRINRVWKDQQKKKFNAALLKYGCSYKDIAKYLPTLTYKQIRSYADWLKKAI